MALAILAMTVMIVGVDQLLWRPLVVWVEKFRLDETRGGGGGRASSWVLDFLRRARLPRRAARLRRRAYLTARRATRPLEGPLRAATPVILRAPRLALEHPVARKLAGALLVAGIAAVAALGLWRLWLLLAPLGPPGGGQLASSAPPTFARGAGGGIVSPAVGPSPRGVLWRPP